LDDVAYALPLKIYVAMFILHLINSYQKTIFYH